MTDTSEVVRAAVIARMGYAPGTFVHPLDYLRDHGIDAEEAALAVFEALGIDLSEAERSMIGNLHDVEQVVAAHIVAAQPVPGALD